MRLAEYEHWRIALDEGGRASVSTNKRIRQLVRRWWGQSTTPRRDQAAVGACVRMRLSAERVRVPGGARRVVRAPQTFAREQNAAARRLAQLIIAEQMPTQLRNRLFLEY